VPAILQRVPALPLTRKTQSPAHEVRTLIDQLLLEQKSLQTPVARFAERQERGSDLQAHYRSLIPLTKPESNEQYAFEVSLDRCTGCKACVSACHSLNGLDPHETWRDAGTLLGGRDKPGWQQTVTTACHHCEDPGCMNGCPVGAYEKDAETGIVRHLDDQCIGCSYCILKCPYDVPKYSRKRGIVRKCDMCHQRLAEGEAPACVQACPTEAIRIVNVSKSIPHDLFPATTANSQTSIASSSITRPTTRYVGREVPATAFSADRDALIPQDAHWPLIFMLVLTQAGIGLLAGSVGITHTSSMHPLTLAGTILFNLGMMAAVFHLGQPLKAWRFFLGLRSSWLSREILAFSIYAPVPVLLCFLPLLSDFPWGNHLSLAIVHSALPLGLLAIFTSVMIYHDTHRALWRFPRSALRFFGTMALFALLGIELANPGSGFAAISFALLALLKLTTEVLFLRHHKRAEWSPDRQSARLQLGPLRRILVSRMILALATVAACLIQPWTAVLLLVFTELLERQLFFQSVQAPKMPGNFGPSTRTH
jgi:formate dehydrogenase iron-sulfur subunit